LALQEVLPVLLQVKAHLVRLRKLQLMLQFRLSEKLTIAQRKSMKLAAADGDPVNEDLGLGKEGSPRIGHGIEKSVAAENELFLRRKEALINEVGIKEEVRLLKRGLMA